MDKDVFNKNINEYYFEICSSKIDRGKRGTTKKYRKKLIIKTLKHKNIKI